jgi:hypothetical protein
MSFDTSYEETNNELEQNLEMNSSWMDEYTRLQELDYLCEREQASHMKFYFLYITSDNQIEKILCETHPLQRIPSSESAMGFTQDYLLRTLQTKKWTTPKTKYRLMDVLLYHVDVDSPQLQTYNMDYATLEDRYITEVDTANKKTVVFEDEREHSPLAALPETIRKSLRSIPIRDTVIEPSLFIFHSLNALYFFYKETECVQRNATKRHIRSILRTSTRKNRQEDV